MTGTAKAFNVSLLFTANIEGAKAGVGELRREMGALGSAADLSAVAANKNAGAIDQEAAAARRAATAQSELATASRKARDEASRASGAQPAAVLPSAAAQTTRPAANLSTIPGPAQAAATAIDGVGRASTATAAASFNLTGALGRSSTAMTSTMAATAGLTRNLRDQIAAMQAEQREAALVQQELDGIRARFDPVFVAHRRYEQSLREIAEARRLGMSSDEATAAEAHARALLQRQTGAGDANSGMARSAAANLSFQMNDIVMMTAMGQSPFMLMIQQGPQVAQIFSQVKQSGLSLGTTLASAFRMVLTPWGLLAMGVIGGGAALVQWMVSAREETKTFAENLEDLSSTLSDMRSSLDVLNNPRLNETFGSLAGDVRGLTIGLLELDRASELQTLQRTLESFGREQIEESWGEWIGRRLMIGPGASPAQLQRVSPMGSASANYAELGAANTYEDFSRRIAELTERVSGGDVEGFVRQLGELVSAMTGGGSFSNLTEEGQKLIRDLLRTGANTAGIEAIFNGSARENANQRQVDQMSVEYARQAELAEAILSFGENSAEVEALRARHARDMLVQRLREMQVQEGSLQEQQALASLEMSQEAERRLAADRRQRSEAAIIDDLRRQEEVSTAILTFGENSAELEAVRERHAREVLQARLEEQGVTPGLIADVLRLTRAEQERARAIRAAESARRTDRMLEELRDEAAINAAIVQYGRDSLEVRRLQIEADRRAYEISLATGDITAERRAELMAAWDAARGLASVDPFGSLAASSDYLRDQQQRIEQLRLEISLIGQSAEARAQAMALYEAERQIRDLNLPASGDRAAAIRRQAVEEANLTQVLERQSEAWQSVQSAAESAIDTIVEKLSAGDIEGALEALAGSISSTMLELTVANPLKNALLGTNYGTLQDLGGFSGILDRLLGRGDPTELATRALQSTVATMQVNAANVMINGAGLPSALSALAGGSLTAANIAAAPASQDAMALLQSIATGGATRADGISGLHAGLANPLAQLIQEAQGRFGADAVQIYSGYRSPEVQDQLYQSALQRYGSAELAGRWVAPAGRSRHNFGLAADLSYGSSEVQSWMHENAGRYGLGYRMGHEPWHIEPNNASALIQGQPQALPVPELQQLGQAVTTAATQVAGLGSQAGETESAFSNLLTRGLGPLGQAGSRLTTGAAPQSVGSMQVQAGQVMVAGGMATGGASGGGFWSSLLSLFLPGFDRGGATGGSSPSEVRGVVHGMEYVFDAASTARIGVANLEALRKGTLKGYRDGGYVSSAAPVLFSSPAPSIAANAATAPSINMPVIVNNFGQDKVEARQENDGRGGRQMVMTIGEATAAAVRQPGNPARRALQSDFNLRPRAVQR